MIAAPLAGASASAQDAGRLRRLEALEARGRQLEAHNREREDAQAKVADALPVDANGDPITPAVMVKSGLAPTIGDAEGNFTFKPHRVIDFDVGAYIEGDTAFTFLGGTSVRRGRVGLEGTAFRQFAWRVEAAFNWYLTSNIKMLLDWVRFSAVNTPMDAGGITRGGCARRKFPHRRPSVWGRARRAGAAAPVLVPSPHAGRDRGRGRGLLNPRPARPRQGSRPRPCAGCPRRPWASPGRPDREGSRSTAATLESRLSPPATWHRV